MFFLIFFSLQWDMAGLYAVQQVVVCGVPVMTVILDGFEVLCVDVLVWVFEQRALQGFLCVP